MRNSNREDGEWDRIFKRRNFIFLKLRIWIFLMYFLLVIYDIELGYFKSEDKNIFFNEFLFEIRFIYYYIYYIIGI